MLKPKLTLLVIIITYSRDQPLMKITFFAVLATETCVMWSSFRAACVAWSRCVAFRDLRSSSWPCAGSTRIWRREWLVSVGWSGFDMQRWWLTETLYHFSYPPVFRAGEQGRFWYAVLGGSLEVRYHAHADGDGKVSPGWDEVMFCQRPGVPDNAVLSNIIDSDYTASPPRCISDVHVQYSGDFDFGQGDRWGPSSGGVPGCGLSPPFYPSMWTAGKRNCWQRWKAGHSPRFPLQSYRFVAFHFFRSVFFPLLLALCLPQQH